VRPLEKVTVEPEMAAMVFNSSCGESGLPASLIPVMATWSPAFQLAGTADKVAWVAPAVKPPVVFKYGFTTAPHIRTLPCEINPLAILLGSVRAPLSVNVMVDVKLAGMGLAVVPC
jgi:hypothetical protein